MSILINDVQFNALSGYVYGLSAASGSTLPFIFGNSNIVTGSGNSQFIQFNQNFLGAPIVLGNISNSNNDPMVSFFTSGISTSGFYLTFSDALTTNNYRFHYLATTGSGFYDIATSLVNQIISRTPQNYIGSGSPEGSIQAVSGSLYTDWYNQTFYMKLSGNATNAYGWI